MSPWALLVVALAIQDERPAAPGSNKPNLNDPSAMKDSEANVDNPPKNGFNDKARGLVFPKSWAHRRRGKRGNSEQDTDINILNNFLEAGEAQVEVEHKKMKEFQKLINEMVRMMRLIENDSDMFFKKLKKREKEVDNAVTHNLDLFKREYEKKRKINAGLLTQVKQLDNRQVNEWDKYKNKWVAAKEVGEKRMQSDLETSFGAKGSITARVTKLAATIDASYADLAAFFDTMVKATENKLSKTDEVLGGRLKDYNGDAGEYVKFMEKTSDEIFETGKSISLAQKLFRKELKAADEEVQKMGHTVMAHAAKERQRMLRMYVDWANRAEKNIAKQHEISMKEVNDAEIDVDVNVRDFKKSMAYDRKSMSKTIKGDIKSSARSLNSGSKLVFTDAKVLEKAVEASKKNQKKQEEGMKAANTGLKTAIDTSKKGTDKLASDLGALQDEFSAALDKGLAQKEATMDMFATQNKMASKQGWADVTKTVEKAIKEDNNKVKVKRKAVSDMLNQAKKQLRTEDMSVRTLEVGVNKEAAKLDKSVHSLDEKIQKGLNVADDEMAKVVGADVKSAVDQAQSYAIKQEAKLEKDLTNAKKNAIAKEEAAREATMLYDPDVVTTYDKDLVTGPTSQLAHVNGHSKAMLQMYDDDNTAEEIAKTQQVIAATKSQFAGINQELKETEAQGLGILTTYMDKDLAQSKNSAADSALKYILPYEESSQKSISKAQLAAGRALNKTDAKVTKDIQTLKDAQGDTQTEWTEGDELLKNEDKVVDGGLNKARMALTDDVSAQAEARGELQNDYDVAKLTADRMWEKESDLVQEKYKEAGEKMEDQISEAERLEKQAKTEEGVLTDRDLRRVEAEEKERVNVMHGDLNRLKEEQVATVDAMHQGRGKIQYWSNKLQGIEDDTITKMMASFDGVMGGVNEMWLNVERGSAEEAALIKGKAMMLQKILDQASEHLDDEQQAEMQGIISQLEKDMHTVMRTVGMTDEERMAALADLQHKAKMKMLGIMEKSEALGPLVKQFRDAALQAGQTEGELLGMESDQERRNQAKQKYAMEEAQRRQAEESKRMLGDIVNAVEIAEDGQSGVLKELRHEGDLDAANSASVGADGVTALDGVADELAGVAAHGADALGAQAQQARWAKNLLAHADETTGDIDAATAAQKAAIANAVAAEKNRLKIGVLYTEKSRTQVLRQLADLINKTQDVSGDLFVQRATAAEQLNQHIEHSLHALEEAGMGDLAEMMRNSLAFSKQMLKQMVDLKLVMWQDAKLRNATGEGAEFMKLRNKLLAFQKKSAAESAALVAQLEEKLAHLGIVGQGSAENMAKFLHQLSFQLANGQADGLEELMSGLMSQFGLALGEGVDSSSILGGTLKALAHKQKVALDVLKASEKALTKTELRFEDERGRVMGMLSRDQQLQSMSDEEFREHIRKLQELLGNVAASAPVNTAEPSAQIETSSLASREQAEAARREAAVAKQRELEERLHRAIRKGIEAHKARQGHLGMA